MATVTKPIALDESLHTSETPSRNIADVLAQELANLSTAVKPNASNILMSDNVTTVQQAITAITNPASVSVTADGVKTYSQLFDALYALIDESKMTFKSAFRIGNSYFYLSRKAAGDIRFTRGDITTAAECYMARIRSSSSAFYYMKLTTSGNTFTTQSSEVPSNGTKIEIQY